jgi:hypothetical protein
VVIPKKVEYKVAYRTKKAVPKPEIEVEETEEEEEEKVAEPKTAKATAK